MIDYVRKFEGNTTMSFRISNKQLLRKYNQIWKKVESLLNIKSDSEPVSGDNDKYIKTKIKTYAYSTITNFHNRKTPKEKAPWKSLSIIMLVSVLKVREKYYPQAILEECKYELKKRKMENLTNNDLEKSLSDESDIEADNDSNDETECDNGKDNDESNE